MFALQEVSLDIDNDLDATAGINLQDPIRELFNLDADPHLRAGMEFFLDTTITSDETYHKKFVTRHIHISKILSLSISKKNHPHVTNDTFTST